MAGTSPGTLTVIAHEVRRDGGMERAMLETIEGLLKAGWKVQLVARVCTLDDQSGLRWIRVRTPRKPFPLAFPLFAVVAALLLFVRRPCQGTVVSLGAIVPNRVDVVTVQFCHAAFAKQRISRASRDSLLYRLNTRISRALSVGLERWCYRPGRLKRMTAVSELVRQELRTSYNLDSIPIEVVPNGVDVIRFSPNPVKRISERERLGLAPDELVALFAGGDWHRKGLKVAIEAVAQADWTLVVVGGGDAQTWGEIARECGARVHFCGHLAHPEATFCAADAFVLPSLYEGFALVTIEAAATGLPLLVTEATGAGTLASKAGIQALPLDASAFASELRHLRDDADRRQEIGLRAREAAEQLTWPRVVSSYMTAYLDGAQSGV